MTQTTTKTRMTRTDIFKFQKPMGASEEDPPVLIYNEDRTIHEFRPLTEELNKLFETDPNCVMGCKFYAIIDVDLLRKPVFDGVPSGIKVVEPQNW